MTPCTAFVIELSRDSRCKSLHVVTTINHGCNRNCLIEQINVNSSRVHVKPRGFLLPGCRVLLKSTATEASLRFNSVQSSSLCWCLAFVTSLGFRFLKPQTKSSLKLKFSFLKIKVKMLKKLCCRRTKSWVFPPLNLISSYGKTNNYNTQTFIQQKQI